MRGSRSVAVLALLALPVCAGACSSQDNVPVAGAQYTASQQPGNVGAVVGIQYASFGPSVVTIKAGQSVEWQWNDSPIPHDVRIYNYVGSGQGYFNAVSSPIQVSGKWYWKFTTPGTYYYQCTIHQGMQGEVIVTS
ncbi:MAG TPA: plastocyanin/azurin family copper-binding protein [Acidimicrobiales bacterium]|nr:plastocyanin/azurin family copper-binding protein [Acidimicrobiales bacterium]